MDRWTYTTENVPNSPIFKGSFNGSYRRSLSDFSTPENNTGINQSFIVSGWHKRGEPSGSLPWIQSALQERPNSGGHDLNFEFEDAGDGDYNDMHVTVDIVD